jgi:hypothetical protein
MLSEVFYAVAAIEQFAGFPVDEADLALLHVHIVQTLMDYNGFLHHRQI